MTTEEIEMRRKLLDNEVPSRSHCMVASGMGRLSGPLRHDVRFGRQCKALKTEENRLRHEQVRLQPPSPPPQCHQLHVRALR